MDDCLAEAEPFGRDEAKEVEKFRREVGINKSKKERCLIQKRF